MTADNTIIWMEFNNIVLFSWFLKNSIDINVTSDLVSFQNKAAISKTVN